MKSMKPKNNETPLRQRIEKEIQEEYNRQINSFKERDDFCKELEYFLEVLSLPVFPRDVKGKFDSLLAGLYCVQAPLELFDALGFQPIRLCSGSLAVQKLSSPFLPALSCPVVKSCVGSFYREYSLEKLCDIVIVPTTCDWNAKLPEMIGNKGKLIHIMELPHIKESERGQKRWLEEIYELKRVLQRHAGRKLNRKQLLVSINKYMKAWEVFGRLIEFRRKRLISGAWSIVLANAFMIDNVESWTERVKAVLNNYSKPNENDNPNVENSGAYSAILSKWSSIASAEE